MAGLWNSLILRMTVQQVLSSIMSRPDEHIKEVEATIFFFFPHTVPIRVMR